MCSEHRIYSLVELAKKQEKSAPKEAARNYLKAAQIMLLEAKNDPAREDKYVQLANRMYIKGKELNTTALKQDIPKGSNSSINAVDIIDNKKNAISFNDVGGLLKLKEEIRYKIVQPFRHPGVYKFYGKSIGGGILMYGPPGCGKTLIAKATAHEAKAAFMHVKSSDIKSKYVGETEKNIAELFEKARGQPTIIFFDEFEALGGDRTEATAHDKNAVAQLLTEIDGMDSKDQQILLLGATNEPWSIDPALRREGRFGMTIYIPPPDYAARKQIFEIVMRKRPSEGLDIDELAGLTKGFSGADIKAVCEAATDIPLREFFKTGNKRKISMKDMQSAITNHKSVLKQWFAKAHRQIKDKELSETFKELAI